MGFRDLFAGAGVFLVTFASGQDSVILRDLTRLPNRRVVSFDSRAITLDDGSEVAWRNVLKATAPDGSQPEFDRALREIGLPRFRLEQRLLAGHWLAAGDVAENVAIQGELPPLIRLQVSVARYRQLIAASQREAAVPFLLEAVEHSLSLPVETQREAAGYAPQPGPGGSVVAELIPIWFDPESAAVTWRAISGTSESRPGSRLARLYEATLACQAGDLDAARLRLEQLESEWGIDQEWVVLLRAQIRIAEERPGAALSELNSLRMDDLSDAANLARWWWLGRVWEQSPDGADATRAALAYLRIAADRPLHQDEVVAAALFCAARIAERQGRAEEAEILRDELLRTVPNTYHGRKLAAAAVR